LIKLAEINSNQNCRSYSQAAHALYWTASQLHGNEADDTGLLLPARALVIISVTPSLSLLLIFSENYYPVKFKAIHFSFV
jgi:hypothetical protein